MRFLNLLFVCSIIFACDNSETVFTRLAPEATGITFVNTTGESDSFNILTNEYIYNGGGVGIGDFDQDGQPDIFFSGSNSENELYLNRGGWKFENVSAVAGIGGGDSWSNGVTIVDVNDDGLDDIYVCSTLKGDRRNQLYLNQGKNADGIPTFRDVAAQYGIDSDGHNTQAAWLDYDLDGDLDLFLLVNEMVEAKSPNSFSRKVKDGSGKRTDRLFRQDRRGDTITFTDVGVETGIRLQGFGLGVTVCDLNQDGWSDLYVTNDYLSNDIAYLNSRQPDGSRFFKDISYELVKHTSYSAMGNDVADLNNDGLPDILSVDMLPADNHRRKMMLGANNSTYLINLDRYGYHPQFTRNTLQLSHGIRKDSLYGLPRYGETAMQAGLPATDWSWTPLVADFDLDGDKDVIVTNGFPRDITDHDFGDYNQANSRFFGIKEMLELIPSVKLNNVAFRLDTIRDGVPQYRDVSSEWGIDVTSFSNGAAYADLDGDGDLDYVVNNIDDPAHLYRNNTISPADATSAAQSLRITAKPGTPAARYWGSTVRVTSGGQQRYYFWHPHRGYLSSHQQDLIVPIDSRNDQVAVRYPRSTHWIDVGSLPPAGAPLVLTANLGMQVPAKAAGGSFLSSTTVAGFVHEERDFVDFNVQPMLLRKLSQQGPALAVTDWNNDGTDDIYVSGSYERAGRWLEGTASGFVEVADRRADATDNLPEGLGSLFFDADGDGDDDLYVVSGSYEIDPENGDYRDRFYRNDEGVFTEDAAAISALPVVSGSIVRAADIDGDGDQDLFVGTRLAVHNYPAPTNSYLLRNDSEDGKIHFSLLEDEALASITNVTDALFTDYDGDGRPDLLVAGEWQPLRLFRNSADGWLADKALFANAAANGWWSSLTAGDFDGDGDIDYVAGNYGHNSIIQPSADEPLTASLRDMDGNGTMDFAPYVYLADKDGSRKAFPFFNRTDFAKQVTAIKSTYGSHTGYAAAGKEAFADPKAGEDAGYSFSVEDFSSVYLERTPEGLITHDLPERAQSFPVTDLLPLDINGDGYLDLVLVGNDHGVEVGQGFANAGNGLVLLGDGQGGFQSLSPAQSGFVVPGEGRALAVASGPDGTRIVAAQNSGPLVVATLRGLAGK